jgi:hypothetical protein
MQRLTVAHEVPVCTLSAVMWEDDGHGQADYSKPPIGAILDELEVKLTNKPMGRVNVGVPVSPQSYLLVVLCSYFW